jgi:hypothetical protein
MRVETTSVVIQIYFHNQIYVLINTEKINNQSWSKKFCLFMIKTTQNVNRSIILKLVRKLDKITHIDACSNKPTKIK